MSDSFICLDVQALLGEWVNGPKNPCGEGTIPEKCTCPDGVSFTPDLRLEKLITNCKILLFSAMPGPVEMLSLSVCAQMGKPSNHLKI